MHAPSRTNTFDCKAKASKTRFMVPMPNRTPQPTTIPIDPLLMNMFVHQFWPLGYTPEEVYYRYILTAMQKMQIFQERMERSEHSVRAKKIRNNAIDFRKPKQHNIQYSTAGQENKVSSRLQYPRIIRNNPKSNQEINEVQKEKDFVCNEKEFYNALQQYILKDDELFSKGYPVSSTISDRAKLCRDTFRKSKESTIESKSEISEELSNSGDSFERVCARCGQKFFVTNKEYITKDHCAYHWGKCMNNYYTCCGNNSSSAGCTYSKFHVWNGTIDGINENLEGFRKTSSMTNKKGKVFAIDCEMCYTVKGLELSRVTVIAYDGRRVYSQFVKPDNKVVDYNSRFSGVTENDIYGPNSKSFLEVQSDILNIVTADSILIGHALENDLRVLKLIHGKVIDTSLIYPHHRGYPYRYSLKYLVSKLLNRQIQMISSGHSSDEDASSCLQLVYLKVGRKLRK